jgi:hypothetical protein
VELHRCALGTKAGEATFPLLERADNSSLLPAAAGHGTAFGDYARTTRPVAVRRLDEMMDFASLPRPVMAKIDVQGAERQVLEGCADLGGMDFIYAELSYVEFYEGQPLFDEFVAYVEARGFALAEIYNRVSTPAFGLTQADVLFARMAS